MVAIHPVTTSTELPTMNNNGAESKASDTVCTLFQGTSIDSSSRSSDSAADVDSTEYQRSEASQPTLNISSHIPPGYGPFTEARLFTPIPRGPTQIRQSVDTRCDPQPTSAFPLAVVQANPNYGDSIIQHPNPHGAVKQHSYTNSSSGFPAPAVGCIGSTEHQSTGFPNSGFEYLIERPRKSYGSGLPQAGGPGQFIRPMTEHHSRDPSKQTITSNHSSVWDHVSPLVGPVSPVTVYDGGRFEHSVRVGRLRNGYAPMEKNRHERMAPAPNPSLYHQCVEKQKELKGISKGYGGDPFNPANQSADIADEENTGLWMTNLPPNCDHKMLLTAIRDCGKVYACVVNPPTDVAGGSHMTAAAKVVFFDRAGADNLLRQAHRGQFKVGEFVPRVRLNRIKSAAREPGPQCRVLHIEGPPGIVEADGGGAFLRDFFGRKFTFELEDVRPVSRNPTRVRQEWRFGSYRCQAEAARQSIHREKERLDLPEAQKALWDQVNVHFGVDPCAP